MTAQMVECRKKIGTEIVQNKEEREKKKKNSIQEEVPVRFDSFRATMRYPVVFL